MKARRVALYASLGVALATVGVAAWMPERVLDAEFARQRWLAGASVHSMQVGDHRWTYLEAGQGPPASKPLIVLVHGFTGSKENWLPLMRALAPRYRLIAPDLPGWGESERRTDADYGPSMQAERLASFLGALNEKPALLVGHSMGGEISGLLAARHPERVDKLLLMSSAGVKFKENDFGRQVLAGKNPFEVTNRAELHRYLGIVFTDPPWVPWPADEALVQRRRGQVDFEQQVLDKIARGPEAFALESELGEVRAPTLLLWCRDDKVIDVSAAEIFHQHLANSRTVLLAGCGHMPMMAQPDNVAEAMESFLAPHPVGEAVP